MRTTQARSEPLTPRQVIMRWDMKQTKWRGSQRRFAKAVMFLEEEQNVSKLFMEKRRTFQQKKRKVQFMKLYSPLFPDTKQTTFIFQLYQAVSELLSSHFQKSVL
jgi:hypothetical protein